jgi:putative transcriptional regulator
LSQRSLAGLLKATEQQIHRWETGKCEIPGPAQVALSGYYIETLDPEGRLKDLMDRLCKLDADLTKIEIELRLFVQKNDEWVFSTTAAA